MLASIVLDDSNVSCSVKQVFCMHYTVIYLFPIPLICFKCKSSLDLHAHYYAIYYTYAATTEIKRLVATSLMTRETESVLFWLSVTRRLDIVIAIPIAAFISVKFSFFQLTGIHMFFVFLVIKV